MPKYAQISSAKINFKITATRFGVYTPASESLQSSVAWSYELLNDTTVLCFIFLIIHNFS